MEKKITFQGIEHSSPLEEHVHKKLDKVEELLKSDSAKGPFFATLTFKAGLQHPHHYIELHVKTSHFDLHTHDEGVDMYVLVESVIDKMVHRIRKEKGKLKDKHQKIETEKTIFNK